MSTEYGQYPQHGEQAPGTPDAPQAPDAPHVPYAPNSPHGATYGAAPPPPPPPPPAWPGGGWAGGDWPGGEWSGYPGQWTGVLDQQPSPVRRSRRRAAIMLTGVAVIALAAGGAAWATTSAAQRPLSAADIASQTDPGLVDITSTLGYQQATSEGTGMVLTSNGEVLTNNHVVDGATSIKVRDVGNGRTYTASVVGYSVSSDVAVLRLHGASGLSSVKIGNSAAVAPGQKIVALGNAEGRGGTPAVATGSVVATGTTVTAQDEGSNSSEHLTGMIRTNADIQPGDSGGPLVNSSGQVVGMDTAAATSNSTGFGTTDAVTTAAFSIPINRAMSLVQQIDAGQSSADVHIGATAFLGVEVSAETGYYGQASTGVPVLGVVQGSAAAAAGLSQGDTLVKVGGHQVSSSTAVHSAVAGLHPGQKVSLGWLDQYGQSHTATVTLTAGPVG